MLLQLALAQSCPLINFSISLLVTSIETGPSFPCHLYSTAQIRCFLGEEFLINISTERGMLSVLQPRWGGSQTWTSQEGWRSNLDLLKEELHWVMWKWKASDYKYCQEQVHGVWHCLPNSQGLRTFCATILVLGASCDFIKIHSRPPTMHVQDHEVP